MHRRTRRTLWILAAVLVFLAVAVFLRSKAPPEAARLLPESDGILYLNLKPVRAFMHKQMKSPQRVPDYQQFVDATGVDWERDDNGYEVIHMSSARLDIKTMQVVRTESTLRKLWECGYSDRKKL